MNCDAFACFQYVCTSKEDYAAAAVKNATTLGVVYASHALEAQHALSEAMRLARANMTTLRVAKDQGNKAAMARAQAAVKASAMRVRELRNKIETSNQLQESCERWATGLQEARQHKHALGAFSELKRQFKSLRMGALVENAENTMADLGTVTEELGDIRTILGAPPTPAGVTDPEEDMRELEALLDMEVPLASAVLVAPPAVDMPPKQTLRLPSVDAYAAALAAA